MASDLSKVGSVISGNRRKSQELTPALRASICAAVAAGSKKAHVAAAFGVSRTVVYNTLRRAATEPTLQSKPRSGRPKKINPAELRYLKRQISKNPQMGWAEIRSQATIPVSISTLKRAVRRETSANGSQKNKRRK